MTIKDGVRLAWVIPQLAVLLAAVSIAPFCRPVALALIRPALARRDRMMARLRRRPE